MPFRGKFDGDGHSIDGTFPFLEGEDVPEAIFCMDSAASIENLRVYNRMYDSPDTEISVRVNNDGECVEVGKYLAAFPDCRAQVLMYAWKLYAQRIADELRTRWERNYEQDGYYVSMSFYPLYGERPDQETYSQNILTSFVTLAELSCHCLE